MRREDSWWWAHNYTREWFKSLSEDERRAWLNALTEDEFEDWTHDWRIHARDKQLAPEGDWDLWLIKAGRGFGKALALDTPVPTPSGWSTMGNLKRGDEIFDERGQVCRVSITHPVQFGRPCFRLRFNDGSSVVADAEHLWATETRLDRKAANRGRPRQMAVRSTVALARSVTDLGETNHSIPNAAPLVLPLADLPLDPYLLGAWLGDGTSACGEITTADPEVIKAFADAGWPVGKPRAAGGRSKVWPITAGYVGSVLGRKRTLTGTLRTIGVLRNKHIPAAYLRGSISQRIALLQGLMDTDGYAGLSHAEFCSTNRALADGVFDLCAGLGMTPRLYEDRAKLGGRDCGARYRVSFRPHIPVFRLERKAHSLPAAQGGRTKRRFIVEVEPVQSVGVRCITVDSPSALYLVGKAMIPTHNTRTAVEFINSEIWENGVRRVAIVGQSEDDIAKVMITGVSGFLATARRDREPRWLSSKDGGTLIWPNGAVGYVHSAMSPGSLRGPEYELAWFDEPMSESIPADKREAAMSNLEFGLRLGTNPRMVMTTTPKPHRFLREILSRAKDKANRIEVTEGSTYENQENLPTKFIRKVRSTYEGTNIGRQEVHGEMLGDEEGAVWTANTLDATRVRVPGMTGDRAQRDEVHEAYVQNFLRTCDEIVVGVDPNMTKGKSSHAAGIIVAASRGDERFIVKDRSVVGQAPAKWAREVVRAVEDYGATTVIAEANQGGDLVRDVVQAAADEAKVDVRVLKVHAQKGKTRRAEPFGAAYERKVVHHVGDCGYKDDPGEFYQLETQMCAIHEDYDPTGEDFDRADAACWALKYLRTSEQTDGSVPEGLTLMTFDQFVPDEAYG